MKAFLIILSTLLLILLIVGGIIVLGPFRDFLPQRVHDSVDKNIPDLFNANRPAIVPQGSGLPDGGDNTGEGSPVTGWTVPGQNGTSINVTPFDSSVASSTGSTHEPTELPISDVVIAGSQQPPKSPTEVSSPPYIIRYVALDKSFVISLYAEPLRETRMAAETEFIKRLGISKNTACNLRYLVLTPAWVNSFYAGSNLGFSFCPGSPQL